MSPNLQIAAVFATMNRAGTAVSCVRALAAQTRPPEWVLVADNDSSDDTVAALRSLPDLPFELVVLPLGDNVGNAGGVDAAMREAFSRGADAVWILDDDSWPRTEALAALLEGRWDPRVVRHSIQINPATGRLTWPLQLVSDSGGIAIVQDVDDLPTEHFCRSRRMWTGALVSSVVFNQVGPVNAGLFIRGEDEEYPWRIAQAGFDFVCCRTSVLDHPGSQEIIEWTILGRHLFHEPGLADWKLYYKIRNMVWLKHRQSGLAAATAIALAYAAAVTRFDGIHRLPLVLQATRDGLANRLGKWKRHGG